MSGVAFVGVYFSWATLPPMCHPQGDWRENFHRKVDGEEKGGLQQQSPRMRRRREKRQAKRTREFVQKKRSVSRHPQNPGRRSRCRP